MKRNICYIMLLIFILLPACTRQNPVKAKENTEISMAMVEKGKVEDAVKGFKKAVQYDKKNADAHYNLALAYYLNNDFKKADEELKMAIKYKPDHKEAKEMLKSFKRLE